MQETERLLDRLFRQEAGKLHAMLTRVFGVHNLELVEDVVQDTLLKALQQWPYHGIPKNPAAWLYQVAKNRALDVLRRERHTTRFAEDIAPLLASEYSVVATVEDCFLETEIPDDQLRMIFTCCHPSLPSEAQIALTLKTLCGFGTAEIAKAFLTNEETIQKRIYRARQSLAQIKFEIPSGTELEQRLDNVLAALYLLFNEGYLASHADTLVREDLAREAMRLTALVCEHPQTRCPRVLALMALLCFHAARFPSRTDDRGHLRLLADQDRSRWDRSLIERGNEYMDQSAYGDELSVYHLEAAIAYWHTTAESYASTRWDEILRLYDTLYRLNPSPLVALNRAIAVEQLHGAEAALRELDATGGMGRIQQYYLYHAIRGHLLASVGRQTEAQSHLKKAIELTPSEIEKTFLFEKLNSLDSR